MKTFLLLFTLIVCNSIGEILSAKGMQQVGVVSFRPKELLRALRQMARNLYLFVAIVSLAISFFCFIGLLSYSDLSFIVPLTAVCYITDIIGARFFLKERISRERWLGTLLVAFGISLISFDKRIEAALGTKALALLQHFYWLFISDESQVSAPATAAFGGIFAIRIALLLCVIAAIVYYLIAFRATRTGQAARRAVQKQIKSAHGFLRRHIVRRQREGAFRACDWAGTASDIRISHRSRATIYVREEGVK